MPADAVANGAADCDGKPESRPDAVGDVSDGEPEPRADGEPESRPDANADAVADTAAHDRGADPGNNAAHFDNAAYGRASSGTDSFADARSNDAALERAEPATQPGSDV